MSGVEATKVTCVAERVGPREEVMTQEALQLGEESLTAGGIEFQSVESVKFRCDVRTSATSSYYANLIDVTYRDAAGNLVTVERLA